MNLVGGGHLLWENNNKYADPSSNGKIGSCMIECMDLFRTKWFRNCKMIFFSPPFFHTSFSSALSIKAFYQPIALTRLRDKEILSDTYLNFHNKIFCTLIGEITLHRLSLIYTPGDKKCAVTSSPLKSIRAYCVWRSVQLRSVSVSSPFWFCEDFTKKH